MEGLTRPQFETAVATHPGKQRRHNEDAHLERPEAGLWAVADGMGGHDAGDWASRTLVEALARIEPQASAAQLLACCEACVVEANGRVLQAATARGTTIGTTLAALLTHDRHYAIVWSGDSRVYLVRGGRIALLSRDHTEVQDLIERGILTAEQGRISPRRNVITRAIGVAPLAELEMAHGLLAHGDSFLLCTDGLTGHVEDGEICAFVHDQPTDYACHALLGLALERGGTDNVTVMVVRYKNPTPSVGAEPREGTVVDALQG